MTEKHKSISVNYLSISVIDTGYKLLQPESVFIFLLIYHKGSGTNVRLNVGDKPSYPLHLALHL